MAYTRRYRAPARKRSTDTRTVWDSGLPVAEASTCPVCGHVNECRYDGLGPLQAHPQGHHCAHFKGMYSAGGHKVVAHY